MVPDAVEGETVAVKMTAVPCIEVVGAATTVVVVGVGTGVITTLASPLTAPAPCWVPAPEATTQSDTEELAAQ